MSEQELDEIIAKEMTAICTMLELGKKHDVSAEIVMQYTGYIIEGKPIIVACNFAINDWIK